MSGRVELDLLPEGAVPPAFIRGLAAEKRVDLSGLFTEGGGYRFQGEEGFARALNAAASVIFTPEDHQRMLAVVAEECAAREVVYLEIRLSPERCRHDLAAWADRIAALTEMAPALERQGLDFRIQAQSLREQGPDAARKAALCAAETAGTLLTGFALAGDDSVGAPRDYAWACDCAREAGLGLAAAAGSRAGPGAIRDALRDLRPDRIDGGHRAIEDLALVDELAEAGMVLGLAPGRDIVLGRASGWRGHPAGALFHRGVKIAVSSVAPAFFPDIAQLHERLHQAFDWDDGVFRGLADMALAAAFCDPDTRARIQKRLT